ncbi:MAG: uncharacterized protein KVP18_002123 [Porospora cf. gigantea A]|uniref:uncharacterized protein n=1 Tax=Porospora cf. gigantea A TaxID=2853593 RepID=UPI0035594756|nr:MAG: hypothetical protein KVP18_002123 [Porospora cf. gigantea A]
MGAGEDRVAAGKPECSMFFHTIGTDAECDLCGDAKTAQFLVGKYPPQYRMNMFHQAYLCAKSPTRGRLNLVPPAVEMIEEESEEEGEAEPPKSVNLVIHEGPDKKLPEMVINGTSLDEILKV